MSLYDNLQDALGRYGAKARIWDETRRCWIWKPGAEVLMMDADTVLIDIVTWPRGDGLPNGMALANCAVG